MVIVDMNGDACEACEEAEIDKAIGKRPFHDANCFWLYHGDEKYPAMSILVRGKVASLNFLPKRGEPGFRSNGDLADLEQGEVSTFFVTETEEQEVINDSIVPFADAVKAAKEFAITKRLPTCLEWFEL